MPNLNPSLQRLARSAKRAPPRREVAADQFGALARHFRHLQDAALWAKEALEFDPDEWQAELLRCSRRRMILNIARQQGKSTTAAARALHRCIFFPKSLVLLVAPAIKQAQELRKKIDDHMAHLRLKPNLLAENRSEVEFDNGSRIVIVAADQDTIRGYSAVDLIIEDESSLVPDDVYEAMEPMLLVSNGQHLLMGTPNGLKGHFARLWHDADEATWRKWEVTVWNNPRVTKERIEALRGEKERLGQLWKFRQEYECSFIAAAEGLVYQFERKRNSSPALDRSPRHGWQFVLGIDYGFTDSTAYVVLGWRRDDPNVYVVEGFDKKGLTPSAAAEIAIGLTKKYPFARIVGDAGGLGKGYVEEARRRFKLPIEAAEKNNKRGYIELLNGDLRAGYLKLLPGNDALIQEWLYLPWDEDREKPADGYKDHLADACLYAWRATYHYLEEIRKAPPKAGTAEAYQAEADEMLEERIRATLKKDIDWWESEDAKWAHETEATWVN